MSEVIFVESKEFGMTIIEDQAKERGVLPVHCFGMSYFNAPKTGNMISCFWDPFEEPELVERIRGCKIDLESRIHTMPGLPFDLLPLWGLSWDDQALKRLFDVHPIYNKWLDFKVLKESDFWVVLEKEKIRKAKKIFFSSPRLLFVYHEDGMSEVFCLEKRYREWSEKAIVSLYSTNPEFDLREFVSWFSSEQLRDLRVWLDLQEELGQG